MILNNFFNVLQMAILQALVVSLPHSPRLVLTMLIFMELGFMLLTTIPYAFIFRFILVLDFLAKFIKFMCMEAFFTIILIITLKSGKERRPVSMFLQELAIFVITAGIGFTYLFTIIKIIKLIYSMIKTLRERREERQGAH